MNPKFNKLLAVLLSVAVLSACSVSPIQNAETDVQQQVNVEAVVNSNTNEIVSTVTSDMISYDEDDAYTAWENQNPNYIKLNGTSASVTGSGAVVNGSKVTITAAGVYAISGKLSNGQIIVDVQDKGTVRLVLNGAEINCSDNAPIYVKNSGKTIISLPEETQNIITDGSNYVLADPASDEPSAAIFSKDDLTINGTGKLTVQANYNDGIASKDDLRITSGTIQIVSVDDGLIGKDMVLVKDGSISIEAGGDGIKATNDTDTAKGFIAIEGGTFNIDSYDDAVHSNNAINITGGDISITAGDDGIHADAAITIAGGKVDIKKSYEGIESMVVTVLDGEIHVTASDDGINVNGGNDGSSVNGRPGQNTFAVSENSKLIINGGNISVNSSGDGLDSNGSIYMTGGKAVVNGPTENGNGALDYNGTFEMSGGVLIAAGSSGMAEAPSEQSTQNSILMYYPALQQAGTLIELKDSKGNTVAAFEPEKEYQSVVISSPELKKGAAYTLYSGETKVVDVTITNPVTYLSETGVTTQRGFSPGGGKGGGFGRNAAPPEGNTQ